MDQEHEADQQHLVPSGTGLSEPEVARLEARVRREVERLLTLPAAGGQRPAGVADAEAATAAGAPPHGPRRRQLVVALSGGGDSVAALYLLLRGGFDVVAAHYDHQLRPESGEDAAFVRRLCSELGVELVEAAADVGQVARQRGWNVEDAARRMRYSFLYKVLTARSQGGAIVVAHTLEDQAETVLLQMLRGTAYPVGISARNRGVIRPLLDERRAVLRQYLGHLGASWVEDATNAAVDQNRAWLRNLVIPQLEQRFPAAQERFAALAGLQQEARSALAQLARRRFPAGPLRLAAYGSAPAGLRKTAVAQRLRAAGSQPNDALVSELDARALAALLHTHADDAQAGGTWRASIPGGGEAEIAYGALHVRAAAPEPSLPAEEPVTAVRQLPAGVDPAVVERHQRLVLRGLRAGDRIRLPGGSKLVSDLLIDLKVPRADRARLRALASGNEVLWIEEVAVAVTAALPGQPHLLDRDRHHMHLALEQARLAAEAGEVPIGAVVVSAAGEVLAAAHNRSEGANDPTAHAEVLALQAAAAAAGDWRLPGATLYVTLEPCPMCLGAVLNTHVARLVYGATNLRDGALGGVTDLSGEGWKRVPEIRGGVMARQAERLLREVFGAKRRPEPEP